MISEFAIINSFLYGTLGVTTLGGIYQVLNKKKPDKLANNDIRSYKSLSSIIGDDGLNVTKNINLKSKFDFEGICLLGSTGAYKTSTLFLNNLLSNYIRGSYVVTDPKGELYELTSGYQKDVCGRKVYKIDFSTPDYSEKYNLLANCKDSEEVIQLASSLLMNGALSVELATGKKAGGIEWIQMAEPLLASMLLYAKDLGKPFNTIEFALQLILNLDTMKLKSLVESSRNLDSITQYSIFLSVGGADRTEGSIRITLATNMKLFTTKDVNKISSNTTFNIEDFRKEESVLYIIYPERKSNFLAPFIAPFFSQIIDKLLDCYTKNSLPLRLMFDEFGNIGMLSNMSVNSATVRSRNMALIVCLQSITQLYQVYGVDASKSILNNLKTKIILPGMSDTDTLDYISKLCGVKEITVKSVSKTESKQSTNTSKTKKNIFEDGELRTLEDKKALVIVSNKMPVVDDIEPYFETSKVTSVIEPIKYKKSENVFLNIKDEIEKIKNRSREEYLEKSDINEKAKNITGRIFS